MPGEPQGEETDTSKGQQKEGDNGKMDRVVSRYLGEGQRLLMWDKWCWNQWYPIVYRSRSFTFRLPCTYLALCTEIPSWPLKMRLCRKITQMCYISTLKTLAGTI